MLPQASSKRALSPIIQRVMPVLAFLVVVGIGWWFVLLPMWSELQATDEIARAESARTMVEKETRALEQLQVDYGALSEVDQLRLSILLPKGEDLPNLLAQVEGLVKQSGFPIGSIGVSEVGEAAAVKSQRIVQGKQGEAPVVQSKKSRQQSLQIKELQVSLTLGAGSYIQFKHFLAMAEQSLRLLNLTSFSFQSNKADSGYMVNFRTPYLAAD